MPIRKIHEPVWNPKTRQWVLNIDIEDAEIGTYTQTVYTEALISAQRYIELLHEKQK